MSLNQSDIFIPDKYAKCCEGGYKDYNGYNDLLTANCLYYTASDETLNFNQSEGTLCKMYYSSMEDCYKYEADPNAPKPSVSPSPFTLPIDVDDSHCQKLLPAITTVLPVIPAIISFLH